MIQKFSVLMSIYIKEKPEYARECFESLLKQSVPATEWVIVEDGPLTPELYRLLDEYEKKYPELIKRVVFTVNRGLGLALRDGVLACTNELIARMDTDDIAREDRFEKQLAMFNRNPDLDICGSHIVEFDKSITDIKGIRKVPITDIEIKQYHKYRDGFNHVTVMFKKTSVLKAGNYQSCLLMEDTLLWANMFLSGATGENIDDYLVYVRTGSDMYARRGGWNYFRKYRIGKREVYKTGYISRFEYINSLLVQLIVSLMPNTVRGWFFNNVLRKKA